MRAGLRKRALAVAALALALGLSACPRDADPPPATSPQPSTSVPDTSGFDAGFVSFGDFGGGPHQDEVAAAMTSWAESHRVDALVTTGDNVYPTGDPSFLAAYLDEPYETLRRTRPLWVTLGNHDVDDGHGDEQLAYLGLPALPYARELDGIQFLFLDANDPDDSQATWLEDRLSEPGPPFRVAVFHQPAYSCGEHGSTDDVLDTWVPVFEEHRIALVLTGHDHLYERFVSPNGVTYVVTGAGGKSLHTEQAPCDHEPIKQASAVEYHFVAGELRGGELTIRAVAGDGTVLDEALIER